MTAPDPAVEALQRRMAALEAEHFAVVEQLRKVGDAAQRNAHSLDDLEDVLTDVSMTTAELDEALAAAMAQRQSRLDSEDIPIPAAPAPPPVPAHERGGHGDDEPRAGAQAPELPVLHAWVEHHIAPMVRKTTTTGEGGGIRWCRQWWEHTDARQRFAALYLAFQELSGEESATWLSVYLRDHLDPHLATLTSPYGPFYACSPRRHSDAIEALGVAELASTPRPERNP